MILLMADVNPKPEQHSGTVEFTGMARQCKATYKKPHLILT